MLDLFAWWNAIYVLPLAFVLVVLTITSVVSLVGGAFGELAQHDAEAGVEHDVDSDLDLDADVDVDADLDVHVESDHDLDADLDGDGHISAVEHATAGVRGHVPDGGHGIFVSGLMALGVGRAPVMMLFQVLILLWGLIGLSLHAVANAAGPLALAWSIPVTLVLSLLGTRGFAQVFGRFFKQFETSAVRRDQMVGRTGTVVYPVTEGAGTVSVRDRSGTLHRIRARTRQGELDSGQAVVVIGYDPQSHLYQVDDASAFVDRP